MSKELYTTLKVNDEEYNINAAHSDAASKTDNALKIQKINLTKDGSANTEYTISALTDFDGSTDESIVIVPAGGGRFKGRITVPPVSMNTLKSDGETVLNGNDIKNLVVSELLNTAVLCTWEDGQLHMGSADLPIKSICIVTGNDSDINGAYGFAAKNNAEYLDYLNDVNANGKSDIKYFSAYIYISTDEGNRGNIYFGTCDHDEAYGVQVSAESAQTANKLASEQEFKVSLSKEEGFEPSVDFDGTASVYLEAQGILPIDKGGTGAVSAAVARLNLGITPENIAAADREHVHSYAGAETAGGKANSAKSADFADKATKDSNGNNISTYYQPKILTGTADPNSSTVTAVKNAPNGAIYIRYK